MFTKEFLDKYDIKYIKDYVAPYLDMVAIVKFKDGHKLHYECEWFNPDFYVDLKHYIEKKEDCRSRRNKLKRLKRKIKYNVIKRIFRGTLC